MSVPQLRMNAPDLDANEIVMRRFEALAPLSVADAERILAMPLAPPARPRRDRAS